MDVLLGMMDSLTCADVLHLARRDAPLVSHAVAMGQRSRNHVGENLRVTVRMQIEALIRLDVILHHHPQRPEIVPLWIAIAAEAERHPVVRPAEVFKSALATAPETYCGSGGLSA